MRLVRGIASGNDDKVRSFSQETLAVVPDDALALAYSEHRLPFAISGSAAEDFRLAFSLRDVSSNKSKVFWVTFAMPDFCPDSLSMSDLQLAREVDREGGRPASPAGREERHHGASTPAGS